MAQIITARLARGDAQPWGFRLQGGKDFGTPLLIQKVHTGSIADKAGLQAGDAVVRINQTDLYNLRHKDAQDSIVQAGPSFELVVQRGGSTWKPTVTPLSSAAASPIPGNFTPVTKTSLTANKQSVSAIGTGHNTAARPFVPASPVRSIVNKQYNSPVAMYSEQTIAETLTSQAEVLAGGCLGVNFKKNEKVYNPEKSEVLKALQENDSEPEPELNLAEMSSMAQSPYYHQPPTHQPPQPYQNIVTKHVTAPIDKPPCSNPLPPGQNICANCERLIVGVFVRIKDKNLHVECFKCATCGTSLKNQGYYNLNNKLYCDVHARLAAMNSPPPNSNGLMPVTFPPKNLGASTISSALNAHAGNLNGNVPSNISAPKPFSYTQPPTQVNPPMAAPKSPSSYPPPSQPSWAPPSAAPAAPKPVGPSQEFIDIEKCNGKPREEETKKKKKREEIYVPCDSDEEFDPKELVNIAKPPPSNFVWPPPIEEQKVPIAAPIYVPVPETLHVTAKPCTEIRPLGHRRLTTQNLSKIEQSTSDKCECINVESNITATTSTTSNASSESEYKMYQTQNNHYVNMFEQQQQEQHEQIQEHDDEVEEINKEQIEIDLRKTPPQIQLPKDIKIVTFVEPEADYKAETFSNVFTKKKETWQKLTESVSVAKREQTQVYLTVEPTDENPENSEVDEIQQEDNEVEEINNEKVDEEVVDHVGPYDGTYYQLAPSNIPQPVPKGYQTGFGKALVYSSEKPYSICNIPPTPEPRYPCLDLFQKALIEAEKLPPTEEKPKTKKEIPKFDVKTTTEQREFPHADQDVRRGSTLLSSMMRTASPRNLEFMKSNIIDEVILPDELEAYFPPPISMTPNEPYPSLNSLRTKSPFVSALTIISDRPFTPFGREIMSQLSLELPQVNAPKTTFSNALHTAPDESFDPSSLIQQPEYDYVDNDPIEYTAKVYERIAVEATGDDEAAMNSYAHVDSFPSMTQHPYQRAFLPKIQPWSTASDQIPENTHRDSISSCQESIECMVSDSRRCSEFEPPCVKKDIHDLLKYDEPEEEFDPDKPCPNAPYPRRHQPSPYEGMQVKITNKMTSGLHKPDEIPQYQKKWFNLPTQNPPRTPEPEELRENVPVAFKEWHETKQIIASQSESSQRREIRVTFAEKPPIPTDTNSRRGSVSEKIQWMEQTKGKTDEEVKFPSSKLNENLFPLKAIAKIEEEMLEEDEEDDTITEIKFPTRALPKPAQGSFPTKGTRKNSIADIQERQDAQFLKQKSLRNELEQQQQRMQQKNKIRQQKELQNMQKNYEKMAQDTIREEIQQNPKLSAYEAEQEYKRQLELEKEQRQKEKEIKEQQAREVEYQRQLEEKKLQEIRFHEKRERDLRLQAQREAEYRRHRDEQEEFLRIQQEEQDRELRREQEEIEKEILRQQEQERREAEERETRRKMEMRKKEEKDRALARIEGELKIKREEELKRLEQEIREKREQRQREEKEMEIQRQQERKAREDAEKDAKRLEEEAVREQKDRERQLQSELKMRQKQDADRKQREEMELFNIEAERKRNEDKTLAYQSSTYQQQHVWPPSTSSTPAPCQQSRPIPIIKTDSDTELNVAKFHFEPLDDEQKRFMAGIRPPSTCYSPPTDEKPYPSIPYYQQHLAFYETAPDHCGIFDPRSISPSRNRSRSPAFGPPPNPMRAFVNRERDPVVDESGIYLCGERLLSPVWYEKGNKKIPPPVQRRIQVHNPSAPHPPPKPDMEAIKESIKYKKQHETIATRAPPTPPPMPKASYKATLPAVRNDPPEVKTSESELPPKGIVASQIRRLSGDATHLMFSSHSSFPSSDNNSNGMKMRHDETVQSYASSSLYHYSQNVEHNDHFNVNNNHMHRHSITSNATASASLLNNNNNNNSHNNHNVNHKYPAIVDNDNHNNKIFTSSTYPINYSNVENVRVNQTGSVGTPGAMSKHGRTFTTTGPNRGQGVLTQPATGRIPICGSCSSQIRGPFVTALGKTWCPAHFLCVNQNCRRELMDIGFVEEKGDLYCEYCFEQFLAPPCCKCNGKIKGDCLNAIGKKFHPECFKCTYCGKLFGNNPFFLEEGEPYCEADWNELFTTKCFACGFPVEAGDRWVEALNNNYHSQCFNCTYCKKNLEGQSFFAKGGRPFCKNHAR